MKEVIAKLPKFERSEQKIVKEFVPSNPEDVRSAGRLVIRASNYGAGLDKFDGFFDTLAADALTFEPPIEIDREDAEVVQYGGERYKRTFGLEVSIPEGHVIPEEYVRLRSPEPTL